ncbi:MAG: adenylate/guanylate cyclase domain-containing protein [Gammaproteobacteria bacterium]|nr:adenylate/guanylate cyclase domain-containing protein [Gammaproteobacteria bacterium]
MRKQWLHVLAPLILLGLVLTLHYRFPQFIQNLRMQAFDIYQRVEPRPYTPVPVLIVDIDDSSLHKLGQWPWPRTRMADLIDRLDGAGASVIGLDIILAEPDRTSPVNVLPLWAPTPEVEKLRESVQLLPDHDNILAAAISNARVVDGFALTQQTAPQLPPQSAEIAINGPDPGPFLPTFTGSIVNLNSIGSNTQGSGAFNFLPEADGVSRRVPLILKLGDKILPSFAAEVLRVAQGADSYEVRVSGDQKDSGYGVEAGIQEIRIGSLTVPTDGQGRMWLYYTTQDAPRRVPAWRLLQSDFDTSVITGSIVLIGTSAIGLKDRVVTPLNATTPGVEVHASIIEQVLLGKYLYRPGWVEAIELLYLSALSIILIFLLPRLGALGCFLVGGASVAVALGSSWYSFVEYGWLFDPVFPSLGILVIYIAGTLINYARSEVEKRRVKHAFAHYLAPEVVERLVADPGLLTLGGEKREMTFLFTDIANFTSLTENIEPSLLVRTLNEYLEGACSVVFKHGGTIDKIVGDALHVMFNAPSDQPDHAARAVRCALELDDFCSEYQSQQNEQAIDLGETRIGVNTGFAVVGNFGGFQRFDYTAHGDAINTAARLESANKQLGTRICISENTARHVEGVTMRPVGRLVLKGKSNGLLIFEPTLSHSDGYSPKEAYAHAYTAMDGLEPQATQLFSKLAQDYPNDGLVQFHAARLLNGEAGSTIVMTSK